MNNKAPFYTPLSHLATLWVFEFPQIWTITHLMFVHDLLIYGNESNKQEKSLATTLQLFRHSIAIEMNQTKSTIH